MKTASRLVLPISMLLAAALLMPALAAAQETPAAPADQTAPADQAAPTQSAPLAPTPESEPARSGPPASGADRISPPPAGKGQVVFFRASKLMGAALSFSVHEGDQGVGKLGNGSYFVTVEDPGQHTFTIQSEATDSLTLEIEAGETYYVKQTIGVGIMMGRPHLTPTDKEGFEATKAKLSTKKPTNLKPKA
jgi:hypothetical protein